jgi:hypothetical protein
VRENRYKNIQAIWLVALMGFISGFFPYDTHPANFAWGAKAPEQLTASLDRKHARIGDTVWLTLEYRIPDGGASTGKIKIGGIEGFTVVEQTAEPGLIRIKIFVDRLESVQTDAVTLAFEDKSGTEQMLTSGPVSLTVDSVLGEKPADAQLRPIRDIILIKGFFRSYWQWIVGVAAFILLLSGAYRWYRKRRRRYAAAGMMEPPHVSARKAIEVLEREKIFEKGGVKAYYFSFSEIMRRYLESLRHFPAVEYTTEEISRQIQADIDRKLLSLLRQADLVKFADTVPTPARKEEDVRLALSYIDETCPLSDDPAVKEPPHRIAGRQA